MAAFGGGVSQQAVGGLLGGVASFFGAGIKLPINDILLFSAVEFNQDIIRKNSEAVKAFGEAMQNIPQVERESVGGFLGGIGAFFSGEEGGIKILKDVAEFGAEKVANIDTVIANAEALKLFGEAMASVPTDIARDTEGGALNKLGSWFSGSEGGLSVLSDLNEFGKTKIENIEQIKVNAEALKLFGEAMSGLSGVEVAKLDFGNIPKLVTDVQSFEGMSIDLEKIRENAAIMNGLGNTFNNFG